MAKLKAHPYADLYPMMEESELAALAEDVAANGLRQPIVRYQGLILDGRNRLLACERAGVEPTFTDYEGDDPLSLVVSLNTQRRDLAAAQRAIVAARALPEYEKLHPRGRPKKEDGSRAIKGRTSDDVATIFKVSGEAVRRARAIHDEAPDLEQQVESKVLSLAAAWEQVQQRRQEADRKKKNAAKVREYADAISGGEMTMEQAIQRAIEQEQEERQKIAAEADARRNWLKEFAEHLKWFETFLFERTDEHLAWYTLPSSPGLFDHGVTPDRVQAVIGNLERASRITFRGEHERNDKKTGDTDRPNAPRRVQK